MARGGTHPPVSLREGEEGEEERGKALGFRTALGWDGGSLRVIA